MTTPENITQTDDEDHVDLAIQCLRGHISGSHEIGLGVAGGFRGRAACHGG